MGGGGSTTMKQNADPWSGAQPYLLGRDNPLTPEVENYPGIFPEAARMYGEGGWTPQMQGVNDLYTNEIMRRATSPDMQFANRGAGDIMRGAFDSNISGVSNISGAPQINAQRATAQQIEAPQTSMVQARQSQGALNPTQSLQQLLSGQPNNPYLDQQAAAITNQLTRNMNENVMPGLRSDAVASGMYGGSRQGIAEGLATSRLNQDLAPALTNLYGGAYENAQNRMQATAGALNDQAFQNAQANATRQFAANTGNVANNLNTQQFNINNNMDAQKMNAANSLATQQFNANLGLQNNSQRMQQMAQNLNNRMQGLNILGTTQNMQDSNYAALLSALQTPQGYDWQNLQQYNSLINPVIGQSTSQDASKNRLVSGLGGALAGGMLGGSLASAGGAAGGAAAGATEGSVVPGYGTAIGAVLGGLAGAFM